MNICQAQFEILPFQLLIVNEIWLFSDVLNFPIVYMDIMKGIADGSMYFVSTKFAQLWYFLSDGLRIPRPQEGRWSWDTWGLGCEEEAGWAEEPVIIFWLFYHTHIPPSSFLAMITSS